MPVEKAPKNEILERLEPLAEADGLVASALLTRALAHEIGNGLNPMGLQVELLRRRCADDARALEILDSFRDSVRALAQTLDRMRDYAHEVASPGDDDDERAAALAELCSALRGR